MFTTGIILLINWKTSEEAVAIYSSGFWRHNSPTLLSN